MTKVEKLCIAKNAFSERRANLSMRESRNTNNGLRETGVNQRRALLTGFQICGSLAPPDVKHCSTLVKQNLHSSHCVDQNQTLVDLTGNKSDVTRAKLKTSPIVANNYTRQHVCLRTPPRREHRMFFAEIDSQSGRSTPTSLQSTPFSSLHATSFALAQQAVVRDL